MAGNDRLKAFKVLVKVIEQRQPLVHALASAEGLTPFTKELCFGVSRQYFRLRVLLQALTTKAIKNPKVELCLLLGLYQLQYTRKADYAVVKETVSLLDKLGLGWAKGLVNGVLREFIRSQTGLMTSVLKDPHFEYGFQDWMLQQWQADWPEHWQSIAQASDEHPPMSLRVNQRQLSRAEYLQVLASEQIAARAHPLCQEALILNEACSVDQLPGFEQGSLSVQDVAAQLCASLLDLNKGMRVLDACCAPGGKLCHIVELHADLAELIGIDVDANRLQKVRENLQRLQLQAHLQVADAAHPEYWWDGRFFDRILLDAPCSASGILRRQPDIRVLRQPEDVQSAAALQQQLLFALWPLLKPGGKLLYATCSIFKMENEQQIEHFMASHQDARLKPINLAAGQPRSFGWQVLPGDGEMDGFFYALIEKTAPVESLQNI